MAGARPRDHPCNPQGRHELAHVKMIVGRNVVVYSIGKRRSERCPNYVPSCPVGYEDTQRPECLNEAALQTSKPPYWAASASPWGWISGSAWSLAVSISGAAASTIFCSTTGISA